MTARHTTLTHRQVTDVVCDLIATQEHVDRAELKPTSHLHNDINMDSLGIIELGMAIEDRLGVAIAEEAADKLETVEDVINEVMAAMAE